MMTKPELVAACKALAIKTMATHYEPGVFLQYRTIAWEDADNMTGPELYGLIKALGDVRVATGVVQLPGGLEGHCWDLVNFQ